MILVFDIACDEERSDEDVNAFEGTDEDVKAFEKAVRKTRTRSQAIT